MQAVVWCVWLATLVTAAVPIEPQNGTAMATLGAPSVGTGGAMLEASQKFTDFMLAAFVPKVQKQIKGVKLPDQKGKSSGFDYHVRSMKIKTVDLSKSKITFKKSQGLSISVPINIEVDGKWSYKLHSIPHLPQGSGSFKAKAGGSSQISTILSIGASAGNPTVKAKSTSCKLNLSIKTSGSLFSWLYNIIIKLFQGSINKQICSAAKGAVNSVISTTLAKSLQQINLNMPVPLAPALQRPGFALNVDLRLTGSPTVTSSSIAVPIRAECRNPKSSAPVSTPPALPTFAASSKHMLSAEVAAWSGERALSVFQHAGFLQYAVTPSIVPASAPFSLNTNFFKVFAPDMYKDYPDRPVTVLANVTSVPKLDFSGNRAMITGDASFAFTVNDNATTPATNRPAFTLSCTLGVGVNISMVTQTFYLHFTYNGCPLQLAHSSMGVVHPTLLATTIDSMISLLLVPWTNAALKDGWAVPAFGQVSLTKSVVQLSNQVALVASDLRWDSTGVNATVLDAL